jgi:23S rRNA pseudouridine2605 synthase
MKADPDRDEIAVDGVLLPKQPKKCYLLLYKPRGYITTLSDERGRKTAAELVADCGVRVWPVGRLDYNSEGLLIFTNDGDFTQKLEHPSGEMEKEYLVRTDRCTPQALSVLRGPITLDGQRLAPAKVELISQQKESALLRFVIHEGKNRQIRRMCELAQLRVLRLKRVREGPISLGDLKPGAWRMLKKEEIDAVFSL